MEDGILAIVGIVFVIMIIIVIYDAITAVIYRIRHKKKSPKETAAVKTSDHGEIIEEESEACSPEPSEIDDNDKKESGITRIINNVNKPKRKPIRERRVDFSPIAAVCAEIQNSMGNGYLSFHPNITVEIEYCDNEGEITRREVDIYYIAKSEYGDNGYYFKGYCHLRHEDRTFNSARVQRAIADGEEVDLIWYLADTYRNSEKYKTTVMAIKVDDFLRSNSDAAIAATILTYIARIDGVFTRKEKTAIAQFLSETAGDETGIEIENYIDGLAKIKPTTTEYKGLVKKPCVSEALIGKAKEITGKDPLRQGAFEILRKQYEKKHVAT
jgi:hypothetical protein